MGRYSIPPSFPGTGSRVRRERLAAGRLSMFQEMLQLLPTSIEPTAIQVREAFPVSKAVVPRTPYLPAIFDEEGHLVRRVQEEVAQLAFWRELRPSAQLLSTLPQISGR